jgi:hypothetical protein
MARYILVVIAIAGIAWAWHGLRVHQRRAEAMAGGLCDAEIAAGLSRRVPELHLKDARLDQAVQSLEKLSGSRVVVNERYKRQLRTVRMDFDGGTIEDALEQLVRRLGGTAGYDARDGTITIAPDRDLPQLARIYDVQDLVAFDPIAPNEMGRTHDPSLARADLIARIAWYINQCYWNHAGTMPGRSSWPKATIDLYSDRLVVVQTGHKHRQLARLLDALRHATGDGSASAANAFPPPSPAGYLSVGTTVRAYDVRDLVVPFYVEAELATDDEGSQSKAPQTRKALIVSIQRSWHERAGYFAHSFPGTRAVIAGRMIIEGWPEDHEKVAQLLRQLRAELAVSVSK